MLWCMNGYVVPPPSGAAWPQVSHRWEMQIPKWKITKFHRALINIQEKVCHSQFPSNSNVPDHPPARTLTQRNTKCDRLCILHILTCGSFSMALVIGQVEVWTPNSLHMQVIVHLFLCIFMVWVFRRGGPHCTSAQKEDKGQWPKCFYAMGQILTYKEGRCYTSIQKCTFWVLHIVVRCALFGIDLCLENRATIEWWFYWYSHETMFLDYFKKAIKMYAWHAHHLQH